MIKLHPWHPPKKFNGPAVLFAIKPDPVSCIDGPWPDIRVISVNLHLIHLFLSIRSALWAPQWSDIAPRPNKDYQLEHVRWLRARGHPIPDRLVHVYMGAIGGGKTALAKMFAEGWTRDSMYRVFIPPKA
jgi:hypothetical protein